MLCICRLCRQEGGPRAGVAGNGYEGEVRLSFFVSFIQGLTTNRMTHSMSISDVLEESLTSSTTSGQKCFLPASKRRTPAELALGFLSFLQRVVRVSKPQL
jgi:hypothetical protein